MQRITRTKEMIVKKKAEKAIAREVAKRKRIEEREVEKLAKEKRARERDMIRRKNLFEKEQNKAFRSADAESERKIRTFGLKRLYRNMERTCKL